MSGGGGQSAGGGGGAADSEDEQLAAGGAQGQEYSFESVPTTLADESGAGNFCLIGFCDGASVPDVAFMPCGHQDPYIIAYYWGNVVPTLLDLGRPVVIRTGGLVVRCETSPDRR